MSDNQPRWAEVEGVRVHYLLEGHDGGRPVALLHGAGFTAETRAQIGTMEALAEVGSLAFAGALPGHGKSSANRRDG